jgi:hypothetical protein
MSYPSTDGPLHGRAIMDELRPAPHPIKGDELRAVLEETAFLTPRETVDVLNARGLLTPYGKLRDMVLVKVWRKRFGIKSGV